MIFSSLSSAQLLKLVKLVEEKDSLETRLEQVKARIDALGLKKGARKPRPHGRSRVRSSLKDAILDALQKAGKAGASAKELAASLKANPGSVSVWFYTTGKKIKGLKKIERGRYVYNAR